MLLKTDEKRKELYDYAVKIGFIIVSASEWKEHKKYVKLRQYIRQGFRIVDYGNEFQVINILDKEFSERKRRNIEDLYEWLTSNSEPKGSTHNKGYEVNQK